MKEELIKISKEKGFKADIMLPYDNYYLWLCSLEKWFRDVHDIFIELFVDAYAGDYWYFIKKFNKNSETAGLNKLSSTNFDTCEQALEKGLQQALKLI